MPGKRKLQKKSPKNVTTTIILKMRVYIGDNKPVLTIESKIFHFDLPKYVGIN